MESVSEEDVRKQLSLLGFTDVSDRVLKAYVDRLRSHPPTAPENNENLNTDNLRSTTINQSPNPDSKALVHVQKPKIINDDMDDGKDSEECLSEIEDSESDEEHERLAVEHQSHSINEPHKYMHKDISFLSDMSDPCMSSLPLSSISGNGRESFVSPNNNSLFSSGIQREMGIKSGDEADISSYMDTSPVRKPKKVHSKGGMRSRAVTINSGATRRQSRHLKKHNQNSVSHQTTTMQPLHSVNNAPNNGGVLTEKESKRQKRKKRDRGGFKSSDPVSLFQQFRDVWQKDRFLNGNKQRKREQKYWR